MARDYKREYKKHQSSTKAKKDRARAQRSAPQNDEAGQSA